MPALTKRFVDSLPLKAERDLTHWDNDLKGFGLRVRTSGAMTWVVMYRNRDNRLRKYTVGPVSSLTPEEARKEAKRMIGEVWRGGDPASEKAARRKAMTVSELADQYQEYARDRIKATTWRMNQSRIECHIKPLIGNRKAASLRIADVEALQRDIAAGRSVRVQKRKGRGGIARGGKGVASRTITMLSAILEYARREEVVKENAARGVRKYATGKRTRFLSYDELAALGAAMDTACRYGENNVAIAAIKALALTGCRRQEILDLPWAWLDADRGCIRFEDTKTGAQVRPIGGAAIRLLLTQRKEERAVWVFPANGGTRGFVGAPRVFKRICDEAKLTDVTLHTLRHTFASVAAGLGYSELTIAGLLGHRGSSVTARYAHVPDRALRSAADHIAERIGQALNGEEVAPITLSFSGVL